MTDHTARPESWDYFAACDPGRSSYSDCLMELRARVERLEQAQQPGPTVKDPLTLHPPFQLRAKWRSEAPRNRDAGVSREDYLMDRAAEWGAEQAQQRPEPEPADDQTLHTVALKMVDSLGRLGVLTEIQDTIRQAIREPMAEPAPSTPAGLVSDVGELIARFASTSRVGDDCTPCAEQVILTVADRLDRECLPGSANLLRREVGR